MSTDKSTTTSIDKPANADSNSSTCGETDGATKESSDNQSKELAVALMAQQLPPLSKFNGSDLSSEEPFQDWIAQFELVAGVYKWSPQAKLIHLTTRLRGEAFTFYRSCSKQQKVSYDLLVKELTRRFTPVRIQSVQTSLFHDRKQGDHESIDSYAQDLKSRFYKAYPQSQQGNEAAESMGRSVLASQFVAGLIPALKPKVAGTEGGFEELLIKARFEEAKLRDLGPSMKPSESPATSGRSTGPPKQSQPVGERRPLLECTKCGGTNHTARYCRWRGRAEPAEARGGKGNSRNVSVRALVPPKEDNQSHQRKAELDEALTEMVTTMHTITSQEEKGGVELGPTLMSEVQLEGCPVNALLDTGSPVSIVSLKFLLEALAKQRKPEESPQQWRTRVEERLQEPPGALLRSFGGETLDMVCQVTVSIIRGNRDITAKVQVQKGAPVNFLLGSDLLPRLGFLCLESQSDDTAVDHFHQHQWKRQPLPHPPPQKLSVSNKVGTVRLLTATRLPPRHTKIVRARVEGLDRQSVSLLTPEAQWESKGLQMEEAVLEPDGELCVSVLIQNLKLLQHW